MKCNLRTALRWSQALLQEAALELLGSTCPQEGSENETAEPRVKRQSLKGTSQDTDPSISFHTKEVLLLRPSSYI